jgi:N-acetylneuraminate synthase
MVETISIGNHLVGPGHPCFIIAEAGVNHNGDIDMARRLIDVAVEAGADAVKFQTYSTERVMSRFAPKANYQLDTTDETESQFQMAKRLELPPEAFEELMAYCEEREIMFLSSPFDEESVDQLAELGVAAFKVPSGEITNLPYLVRMARFGRPMIVSTGMADLAEVETAVRAIRNNSDSPFVILQCTSNYPAEPSNANLYAMATMAEAFGVLIGYSDHTPGIEVALAAVALGASVIEKHFTLDSNLPGPDHKASLEPSELSDLIEGIRNVEAALGTGVKAPVASEKNTSDVARKSLVAAISISPGTALTEDMIAIKRPGTGIPPVMLDQLVGRTVRVEVVEDSLISMDMFEEA